MSGEETQIENELPYIDIPIMSMDGVQMTTHRIYNENIYELVEEEPCTTKEKQSN